MTAAKYAKTEIAAGRFPSMLIVAGQFGTFWLESADYRTLDKSCSTSREAAEKARSKAIEAAMKFAA